MERFRATHPTASPQSSAEKLICCDECNANFIPNHNPEKIKWYRAVDLGLQVPFELNKCDVCGGGLATVNPQRRDKMFACSRCSQVFARGDRLLAHSAQHTHKKAFACHICHASFSRKNRLTIHREELHNQGRRRAYECGVCHREFSHHAKLRIHLTVRLASSCHDCGFHIVIVTSMNCRCLRKLVRLSVAAKNKGSFCQFQAEHPNEVQPQAIARDNGMQEEEGTSDEDDDEADGNNNRACNPTAESRPTESIQRSDGNRGGSSSNINSSGSGGEDNAAGSENQSDQRSRSPPSSHSARGGLDSLLAAMEQQSAAS